MDAHALLTSQGWRGTGHSLHPTSDLTGLSKPILVSQKRNTLGVGKKQHKTSDMWWMNAFDSSLKGLDTSKEGVVVQTITSGGLDMVARGGGKYVGKGGLYACFVRGEMLGGTLTPESMDESVEVESSADSSARGSKKRKREDKQDKGAKRVTLRSEVEIKDSTSKVVGGTTANSTMSKEGETKEQRRARKAAEKVLRTEVLAGKTTESSDDSQQETKEQRRERRRLKKLAREQEKGMVTMNTFRETVNDNAPSEVTETKEERRERRRLKKLALETATESVEGSDAGVIKKKKEKKRKEA